MYQVSSVYTFRGICTFSIVRLSAWKYKDQRTNKSIHDQDEEVLVVGVLVVGLLH